jgi:hypothetical protein
MGVGLAGGVRFLTRMSTITDKTLFLTALVTTVLCSPAMAQELSPRAYWPAPVGTDVAIVSWQRNDGDILIDPSLPITGVESEITYLQVAYQRFLDLWGRTASLQVNLPYADGTTEGTINGEFRRRQTSGLTDARLRLTVNLKGAPAMDAAGFRDLRANPQTIIGASVIVQAPTGDYDGDRVINLGTNRWSIKPAIGMIVPLRPTWLFEAEAGAWFFEDNDDFLGATREQKPVFSLELHLVKRVAPGFWATLDANYYRGGETRAGDGEWQNLQRNSRAGFTVVFPIQGRHAFRGSFSTGVATRSGGEYDIYSLSYIYAW